MYIAVLWITLVDAVRFFVEKDLGKTANSMHMTLLYMP